MGIVLVAQEGSPHTPDYLGLEGEGGGSEWEEVGVCVCMFQTQLRTVLLRFQLTQSTHGKIHISQHPPPKKTGGLHFPDFHPLKHCHVTGFVQLAANKCISTVSYIIVFRSESFR